MEESTISELGIEHLAPHLPHKLKVQVFGEKPVVMNATNSSSKNWVGIGACIKWSKNCKPVLYPLDMIKEMFEHDGHRLMPKDVLEAYPDFNLELRFHDLKIWRNGFKLWPYGVVQKLYEWHFDVDGLIPAGLAVDATTLDVNPYTQN